MRQDILEDLYKAIDQFTISLELCDKVSELRFGDVIQLRDELQAGKRYSEVLMTYTIWLNHDGDDFHLVQGEEPLRSEDGKPHFYCGRNLTTFTALNYSAADEIYKKWCITNIGILPK